MLPLRLEPIPEGFRVYAGDLLYGVVTTKTNDGTMKNGAVVWQDMPRGHWAIHFTSPSNGVEFLKSVIEAVLAAK